MGNWGEMLPEMLSLICKRVSFYEDLVTFGGVCSTWRHAAVEQNLGIPLIKPPFPWLMLAENQDDDVREFYSLTERKSYRLELPELRGKKCMETKGWIVTVSDEGEMALVHPLTRVTIPLPHQNTSKYYHNNDSMEPLIFVQAVVLSSPPDPENERECVVMILHGSRRHVGFCRLGDKNWTLDENIFLGARQSAEYYRGKFYVVNYGGEISEYDVIGKSKDTITVSKRRIEANIGPHVCCTQAYLVESFGSLLVVKRKVVTVDNDGNYGTTEFWVHEIDVERRGYKDLESLGTRSIFLGHSASLSVDTTFYPELIPNSIYFTDDSYESYLSSPEGEGGGTDMGVYNLEDKTVKPHYSGKSLSLVCPPVWTFLTTIPLRKR